VVAIKHVTQTQVITTKGDFAPAVLVVAIKIHCKDEKIDKRLQTSNFR